MTLNYLTVPVASAIIFGVVLASEWVVGMIAWMVLSPEMRESAANKQLGDLLRLAVFFMNMVGFLLHCGFSLYSTYLLERQMMEGHT